LHNNYRRIKFFLLNYAHHVQAFDQAEDQVKRFTNQKIILTINHAIPIKIRPVAACFKIVNQEVYLSSLPAEVTIWKPPYKRIINAINARIPSIQLIAHFTTLTNASCCPAQAQTTLRLEDPHSAVGLTNGPCF
jgi:hypothetical protein